MIKNDINGLVQALDECLAKREKQYAIIDADYTAPGGDAYILSSQYDEYKRRKDAVTASFERDFIAAQDRLMELCSYIRKRQPRFTDLRTSDINTSGRIPRNIVFGRTQVTYKNLDILVPHTIPFPVDRPVVLPSDRDTEALFSMILRLMYTLPLGRLELNAYDPNLFGASLQRYNKLFTNKEISPFGKICHDKNDLAEMLKKATHYCENLIQNVFNNNGCGTWREYNDHMCATGQRGSVLPYKVLFLCDFPDNINADCMDLLVRLSNVCGRCGMLIAMTVNGSHFTSCTPDRWDNSTKTAHAFVESCCAMEELLSSVDDFTATKYLTLTPQYEPLPEPAQFDRLVSAYIDALKELNERGGGFYDLFDASEIFSSGSVDGLDAALGMLADESEAVMPIGNETPHVLIGGTTGSGKSNLLHVMITNLCKRYSPDELALYMLDFKEGVELNAYANPVVLPHARLIATEADVEFGLSTLQHIDREVKARYSLFKKAGCKQYSDYRKLHPDEVLPRIIVFIDEFQVLFEGKDNQIVFSVMESIVKQGRAAGVHLVMATQTLSGLATNAGGASFGGIASQFGGRIALKCSATESATLLGAVAGNDAAALLKIPFAIMNTCSGVASANVKFAVPNADGCVGEATERIAREWQRRGGITQTKLFNGDSLPAFPDVDAYLSDHLQLLLGETADYDCDKMRIELNAEENIPNIVFFGTDKAMLEGLRHSVMLSADGSAAVDEIIVVGRNDFPTVDKKVTYYNDLKEFASASMQEGAEPLKNRLIILNGSSPVSELGYTTAAYPPMGDEGKWFRTLIGSCAVNGTHIAAFYSAPEQFRSAWISNELFGYVVAFSLTYKSLTAIGFSGVYRDDFMPSKRALLYKSGVEYRRFRPYVIGSGENDE